MGIFFGRTEGGNEAEGGACNRSATPSHVLTIVFLFADAGLRTGNDPLSLRLGWFEARRERRAAVPLPGTYKTECRHRYHRRHCCLSAGPEAFAVASGEDYQSYTIVSHSILSKEETNLFTKYLCNKRNSSLKESDERGCYYFFPVAVDISLSGDRSCEMNNGRWSPLNPRRIGKERRERERHTLSRDESDSYSRHINRTVRTVSFGHGVRTIRRIFLNDRAYNRVPKEERVSDQTDQPDSDH